MYFVVLLEHTAAAAAAAAVGLSCWTCCMKQEVDVA